VYTIGQLAKHSELTIETIRFYERKDLLKPDTRSDAGYRLYNESSVERLVSIKRAKSLGFTINEIRDLLDLTDQSVDKNTTCESINKLAQEKLIDIEQKINHLNIICQKLLPLLNECSTNEVLERCPIVRSIINK